MTTTRPDPTLLLPPDELEHWRRKVAAVAGEMSAQLFADAMVRTLSRTLHVLEDRTVFVITGDIPAMWLRDSATQMLPYLRIAQESPDGPLADLLIGIVRRQLTYLRHDPYANAFNIEANGRCHEPRDLADDPWLWERKYEIDSLCFPFLLAHQVWSATGRSDHLDATFVEAARAAVTTLDRETAHEEWSDYRFVRPDTVPIDTLTRDGRGTPVGPTGMTWAGFRPSDDACTYGYHVPGNLMAVHCLRLLGDLVPAAVGAEGDELVGEATALADRLADGIATHGLVDHPRHGQIWAYEVDGLGQHLLMDDANMPGLLSLPLVAGIAVDDPVYRRTRAFVLSDDNPYYYRGRVAAGVGSPHTPERYVWPIALAVEGLTSESPERALELLVLIASTTAGTGHVHEGFDVDDETAYTRPWFSWADSMFCALALSLV
ncbi:MAG TPA: glycoside hydrolase family 125 protein [Microlunatus sp.]|nr:glycoside hydrolase family 125 protein [Microlunatus sp.]